MSCLMHRLYAEPLRKPAVGDTVKVEANGWSVSIWRRSERTYRFHFRGPGTWGDLWARDWHEAWSNLISVLPDEVLFEPTKS